MQIKTDHDLLEAIHENTISLGNRISAIETRTKEMRDKINIVEYNSQTLSDKFSRIDERQKLYEQLFDEFRRNHELDKTNIDKRISDVVDEAVKNKFIRIWNRILKTIVYIIVVVLISLTVSFTKGRYPVIEKILKGVSTTL